jgi:uncharacterized protein (TIGR02594 family)
MNVSAYDVAHRYVGCAEVFGATKSNPAILAMLQLDQKWPDGDHVPWCSAFVNHIAWLLDLPRSEDLRARSWLAVGEPVDLADAVVGGDVVIFSRGRAPQPGPEVLNAPGHVGFFAGETDGYIYVLGGNQSDAVNIGRYPAKRLLGVRRLHG